MSWMQSFAYIVSEVSEGSLLPQAFSIGLQKEYGQVCISTFK